MDKDNNFVWKTGNNDTEITTEELFAEKPAARPAPKPVKKPVKEKKAEPVPETVFKWSEMDLPEIEASDRPDDFFISEEKKRERDKELQAKLAKEEREKARLEKEAKAREEHALRIQARREKEEEERRKKELKKKLAREAREKRAEEERERREKEAEERAEKALKAKREKELLRILRKEEKKRRREARAAATAGAEESVTKKALADLADTETELKYKRPAESRKAVRAGRKAAKAEKKQQRKKIPKESRGLRGIIHKERSRFAVVLDAMLFLSLCAIITGMVYVGHVAYTTKDIDPENIYSQIEMTSFLYDSEGHEIDKIYYSEDRELVSIDEIPEDTKDAFIAIEDKTFYEHHGFNFRRMFGAVLNKLLGRSDEISGTSTITQQLARNVYLADIKSQRTIRRKLSEMFYAWKIERTLSKDEILEAYLNTIYLGYGNYGIEAAARSYFDKDVRDLDLAESAALAALPQAPDSYALLKDEEEEGTTYLKKYDIYANDSSKERRDLVLSLMKEQGYISGAEAAAADVEISDILKPHREKKTNEYTYFSDYVVTRVAEDLKEEYGMSDEEAQRLVYTGGLSIRTTVDSTIQKIINEEFADDSNFPWSSEEPQAAMVVTDVHNGSIRAMVGGREKKGKKLFNRAVSPRQPGSSIKPLSVYSAALQKSCDYAENGQPFPYIDYGYDRQGVNYWGDYITASSYVEDERMTVNGEEWPQNFSRTYSGRQTFRTALQQSINTCAVKIMLQVGAEYSMDILRSFGITTAVDDPSLAVNDLNSAALGLGAMAYGVTPLEMAEAYAVFPNGGKRNDPVCYTEVTDASGKTLLKGGSMPERVLDEGVAFIMTDCLKSVVSAGIARSASIYGVQVGGKTGTTNDTADIWFCGFTPKYSAALWIGTDHNSEMNTTSNTAAALWSRIMSRVPDITEGQYETMPEDVVYQYGEYYTDGTVPTYQYYGRRWRR